MAQAMEIIETDVLVVGSGPAGLTTAVGLASQGVDHIVITKYQWTANTKVLWRYSETSECCQKFLKKLLLIT